MIKKYLPAIIITALLTVLPIVLGLILWGRLPDPMPTHFNASGEADGFMSKAAAVFALPASMLLVHIVCTVTTFIDPKRRNIDGKPIFMVLWICPVMSILVSGFMYAYALGMNVNITTGMFIAIGILFIILGNYLPKCGPNYSIGIKVPWSLNDEANWQATHRFGGKVFVAAGVVTVILAFFVTASPVLFWVYFAVDMIACAIPAVYSYVYYLRHGKKED